MSFQRGQRVRIKDMPDVAATLAGPNPSVLNGQEALVSDSDAVLSRVWLENEEVWPIRDPIIENKNLEEA